MAETFDSVMDRIGAFNAATEAMSKGRAREILVEAAPDVRIRLVRTDDNYAIEVQPLNPALAGMGFSASGTREVRKSERSWNVASQLEDILQDVLQLGSDVRISVETLSS
jgi:hypothetical protein